MNTYLTFKALHLIAVISWMAGLLYLPRIFVYHSQTSDKNLELNSTFKTMEKRLFIYIMNPSMILSWIFGLLLIHSIGLDTLKQTWLLTKIFLVILLTFTTFSFSSVLGDLVKIIISIRLNFLELSMKYQQFY